MFAQDGEQFVALASFCADLPRDATELPLKVKLLVDCSGSMGGDSIDAAKRALHRILAGLAPEDRFSFSRFGSTVVHETKGLVAADGAHVRAASERLAKMDADLGGTEMPAALRSVFGLGGSESAADVLLITDGEVWNAEGLVAEARAAKQRVFVVGIGSAPAEGVLKRLAEASGGACEFVAPNEDAEGAILRMFARLRAPRVERAEIAWAATPAWTTPLPSALFGGETVHAFAGFASVPAGMATLKLVPRGEAAPLTAQAPLPTTLVVDRTLARVAAARWIETAAEAEQLKLALDYGLLTARTNLLVVHERAEGEKAKDLPELAQVAQMHAAGWHGVGLVHDLMLTDVHACSHMVTADIRFASEDQTAVLRRPSSLFSVSERHLGNYVHFGDAATDDLGDDGSATGFESPQSLDRLLAAIESAWPRRLPATLGDLAGAGLPPGLLTLLEDLVRSGHDEKVVVRALLEALGAMLADGSIKARASRQFVRALSHQFARDDEARDVRRAVRDLVRAELRMTVA